MKEMWQKIYSKNKKLMYEGFTVKGKPFGTGTSYYANGNKFQEGVFDNKGLIQGREYYETGILRFEGAYKHNDTSGPNYPAFGTCYDEDGNEFFYGEIDIYTGHIEYPVVRIPQCYGPLIPKGAPDFNTHMWKANEREPEGIYFARPRGKKARTKFVEFLEKNGFKCINNKDTTRESTIESKFPVTIDMDCKVYGHLHTATSAAAAASSRRMFPVDRYYMLFECVFEYVIV